ncbi:hypothetical protein BK136_19975 [Paenibacillus amylolyticus]|nr:hypothetical protein BK136_19975 [Paenibacillus amylolyticus]
MRDMPVQLCLKQNPEHTNAISLFQEKWRSFYYTLLQHEPVILLYKFMKHLHNNGEDRNNQKKRS